jgi:hydrogenase maturation protease
VKDDNPGDAVLIIGYGNTLRGDDGAGRRLAEELAERKLPRVRTLSVHQLTPELAEDLAACGAVIFVDARLGRAGDTVSMCPIAADGSLAAVNHAMRPHALLAYARAMFGTSPRAWWLTVPGEDFEFGESLSAAAMAAAADALALIEQFTKEDQWKRSTIAPHTNA